MKNICSFIVFIIMSVQPAYAIVGFDPSEIKPDSPVYYNTVALVKKNNQSYKVFCSASIAAENLVFTAKHCIEAVEDLEIFVYFGDDVSQLDMSLLRKIKSRSFYNEINLELSFPSFDFGYLEFEGAIPSVVDSVTAEARYRPIKILTKPEQVLQAESYIVAGYGISEISSKIIHGIKRRVTTHVRDYVSNSQFTSLLLLDGKKGEGTCHGDSGGPLYAKFKGEWFLVGAASGFDVGLTPGSYKVVDPKDNELAPDCYGGESVYTYVGDYVNWVEDVIDTDLLLSEPSNTKRPGLDTANMDSENYSFSDWCKNTNYESPAWETIRQLLYFAADAKSEFSSDQVLSSCDTAELVLNNMKSIDFNEDDFFNDLSPINSLKNIESLSFVKTKKPDLLSISILNGKLKSLKLAQVGAENIMSINGLVNLTGLEELNLTGNSIKNIDDLSEFVNLKSLKLSRNKISDISLLKSFKKLEVIELFSNSIISIDALLELSLLKELLVSNNNIISPKTVANWPNLEMAILSENKLTDLDFIKNSKKIKRLKTYGNPLKSKK